MRCIRGDKTLARLHTCTIITGEPNEFVREIDSRMRVILPEKSITILGYRVKPEKGVLIPFPADRMRARPVSPSVNSPTNNDADIIAARRSVDMMKLRNLISQPIEAA